jgi:hypothetical protein
MVPEGTITVEGLAADQRKIATAARGFMNISGGAAQAARLAQTIIISRYRNLA